MFFNAVFQIGVELVQICFTNLICVKQKYQQIYLGLRKVHHLNPGQCECCGKRISESQKMTTYLWSVTHMPEMWTIISERLTSSLWSPWFLQPNTVVHCKHCLHTKQGSTTYSPQAGSSPPSKIIQLAGHRPFITVLPI